jgi:mRNA deadenylase 3'-5' endonuclease subunit Ccr4
LIKANVGYSKLKEHLTALTLFAKAVGYNWNNWKRMVESALPKFEADGSAMQEIEFQEEC